MTWRSRLTTVLVAIALLVPIGLPATALSARGPFIDDDTSIHEGDIDSIQAVGITLGCNPPTNNRFCPVSSVTRGQLAAFLRRAGKLPASSTDFFTDDNSSIFEGDINSIAAARIARGCNPPTNSRFCPNDTVSRAVMAAFLARALDLPATSQDFFIDDNTSPFEDDINRIAAAQLTFGCNPPTNNRFCPNQLMTRAQMASFLTRAYDLPPVIRNLPLQHSDYVCSKTGLICSANVIISANRTYRVTEGWYQFLPYLGNEQSIFSGSSTRFELRVDGQLVSVTHLGVSSSGGLAIRRWRREMTLSPGMTVQGRWIWNNATIRTTNAKLVSG